MTGGRFLSFLVNNQNGFRFFVVIMYLLHFKHFSQLALASNFDCLMNLHLNPMDLANEIYIQW